MDANRIRSLIQKQDMPQKSNRRRPCFSSGFPASAT